MTGLEKLKAFARSPHHAWLGLLTLGLGVASVSAIGVIVGTAAYALGWIYLPDSGLFNRWLSGKSELKTNHATRDFLHQRRVLFDALSAEGKGEYGALAQAAEELRDSLARDSRLDRQLVSQRVARLSQFAWTYLRLVHTGEQLQRLLSSEDSADLAEEVEILDGEVNTLRARHPAAGSSEDRLIESKAARLDSLRQRLERRKEASASLELTLAEKERIVDLLKLMRADFLASRDANLLSHEIDGASLQLDRTRDWLRELEFDTSPADIPDTVTAAAPLRVGQA